MSFGLEQEVRSLIYPMALAIFSYIFSILLIAGRGISAETCGLDDVFPPDDLCSRP